MEGIVIVVGFVFILAIFNEVWNARFDRMRDQIYRLSDQVDHLERQQGRMKGSIERMRERGLTGIEPGGRFRG